MSAETETENRTEGVHELDFIFGFYDRVSAKFQLISPVLHIHNNVRVI